MEKMQTLKSSDSYANVLAWFFCDDVVFGFKSWEESAQIKFSLIGGRVVALGVIS